MMITDIEEEYKEAAKRAMYVDHSTARTVKPKEKPIVYISGVERYQKNGDEIFAKRKSICEKYGFEVYTPMDWADGVKEIKTENPYIWAYNKFDNYQQHVRNCDVLIADLNDYRGYEVNNEVGFECGMAFQLGKKLYGYQDNTSPLVEKLPHLGEEKEFRDHTGSNVENFGYPANLMFGSSMKIFEGKFEEIMKQVAEDYFK